MQEAGVSIFLLLLWIVMLVLVGWANMAESIGQWWLREARRSRERHRTRELKLAHARQRLLIEE